MNLNNIDLLDNYNYQKFFPFEEFKQDQEETKSKSLSSSSLNLILISPYLKI